MKIKEREEAIKLRKSGYTYKEILESIHVSKASLSYWLRGIGLTSDQKDRIYGKNLQIRRKFIEFNDLRHLRALSEKENIIKEATLEIKGLSGRELMLIGIALYWAEGYKTNRAESVEFANSDPLMIKIMIKWFTEVCLVPLQKVRIRFQLHNAEDIKRATEFWSSTTGMSSEQFTTPYLKISPTSKRRSGNRLPNGICHIRISDTKLLAKIRGWIKGLSGAIV